jgi:hypothetical protein
MNYKIDRTAGQIGRNGEPERITHKLFRHKKVYKPLGN